MGVWRKWVFPAIRIVLVAAIAAALVKLAFFPDRDPSAADALVPTGTVVEPDVVVERGSIANDLRLDGTVNADAAVPVKAAATGEVDEVFVAVGTTVTAGQKLFDIKVANEVEPVETVGEDGVPVVTVPKQTYRYEKVLAPVAGVLSSLDVIAGQPVSTGAVSGQVAPPSFNVTATLSPEQQYRLASAPTEATVTITGGPAPFACGGLTITTPLSGAGGGDGATGVSTGVEGSGTTVRCAVPGDVRVFPGLAAKVVISAGAAADVLVVPVTAVSGGAESGVVWVLDESGEQTEQPVKLGITDGTQVEVVEGLAEGDRVLQFVPGAAGEAKQEACVSSDGMTWCGEVTQ
ncbi:efflux RND transporter periplasmic adaptor subunit [Agromyces seonyuensis]|uniref:Multidrug resistance protein MdtA-like C-terminal permuted SH3 domain-containing protein n=1 Tax=Agromyces seonyuensis TaxID=2662446 RepID=A0A6I4P132_9MICO|nr:hypothetical protein [Agromyces seonyuensis]MWC00257.1 hypothetical protein [Agromyces seonyuensis]